MIVRTRGNKAKVGISTQDQHLDDVIAGTNITIDKTDPKNPIISSTSSGGGATEFNLLFHEDFLLGETTVDPVLTNFYGCFVGAPTIRFDYGQEDANPRNSFDISTQTQNNALGELGFHIYGENESGGSLRSLIPCSMTNFEYLEFRMAFEDLSSSEPWRYFSAAFSAAWPRQPSQFYTNPSSVVNGFTIKNSDNILWCRGQNVTEELTTGNSIFTGTGEYRTYKIKKIDFTTLEFYIDGVSIGQLTTSWGSTLRYFQIILNNEVNEAQVYIDYISLKLSSR